MLVIDRNNQEQLNIYYLQQCIRCKRDKYKFDCKIRYTNGTMIDISISKNDEERYVVIETKTFGFDTKELRNEFITSDSVRDYIISRYKSILDFTDSVNIMDYEILNNKRTGNLKIKINRFRNVALGMYHENTNTIYKNMNSAGRVLFVSRKDHHLFDDDKSYIVEGKIVKIKYKFAKNINDTKKDIFVLDVEKVNEIEI